MIKDLSDYVERDIGFIEVGPAHKPTKVSVLLLLLRMNTSFILRKDYQGILDKDYQGLSRIIKDYQGLSRIIKDQPIITDY